MKKKSKTANKSVKTRNNNSVQWKDLGDIAYALSTLLLGMTR